MAASRSEIAAPMQQAASFADAALRRVLEVIDRRRPVAQLHGLLAAGLAESVLSASRFVACQDGAAVLRRLRLQAVRARDRIPAAEVFGTYSRGCRIHAVACRIELRALPCEGGTPPAGGGVTGGRWQVVALHIG